MEEAPLFPMLDQEGNPSWRASADSYSTSFAAHDADTTENWSDFMRWDPASNNAPANSDGSEEHSPHTQDHLSHLSNQQLSQGVDSLLDDSAFASTAGPDAPHIEYSFGDEVRTDSAFDFEFNAITSGQDVAGLTQAAETQMLFSNALDQDALESISPLALKVEAMNDMNHPPHPPTVSSSRTSIDHSNRSPSSATGSQGTPPSSMSEQGSPEPPRQANARKRKSMPGPSDGERAPRKNARGPPIKKTSHNMIEKRYRNKLNDKIEELKNSVPSLKRISTAGINDDDDDGDDLDGLTPAHKTNKATVLSKATEYIKHLEKKIKQQQDEMRGVKEELDRYRKLDLSAPAPFGQSGTSPDGSSYQEDPFVGHNTPSTPGSHAGAPPQGMIPVPENILNLQASGAPGPHYGARYTARPYTTAPAPAPRPQQQAPMVQGRGGPFNKFMVGALAGLMILEGINEREADGEDTEGRGLSALPLPVLRVLRLLAGSANSFRNGGAGGFNVFPVIRALLLVAAIAYLVYPLLNVFNPRGKRSAPTPRVIPTTSVASPVELRQKAWLTSSQGVWIPHHNLFYELAAIGVMAFEFTTRRLFGFQGYAFLTGMTAKGEEARVKTWKIALDAQLTGGDVEISATRLILTLFASGTLPSTPATLMLKALHSRVLFWRFAKAGWAGWYLFDVFCARMSARYWNKARAQYLEDKWAADPNEVEPLPEHLAALLELECDDVLIDPIVQRAYNLAWNRPCPENTDPDDSMDAVVEDFAISGPLDALAAWYSTYTLNKALTASLSSADVVPTKPIDDALADALAVAPPNSTAHSRALVARAAITEAARAEHTAAAHDALLAAEPPAPLPVGAVLTNSIGSTPVPADAKIALVLAKCVALLRGAYPDAGAEAEARAVGAIQQCAAGANASRWSLLSFAAAYKALNALAERALDAKGHDAAVLQVQDGLAGTLRLWVGKEEGRSLGLSKSARGRVVERCLALRTARWEGASEGESGYGSAEI